MPFPLWPMLLVVFLAAVGALVMAHRQSQVPKYPVRDKTQQLALWLAAKGAAVALNSLALLQLLELRTQCLRLTLATVKLHLKLAYRDLQNRRLRLRIRRALFAQLNLGLEQREMLAEYRRALDVSERGDQAAQRHEQFIHGQPLARRTPDASATSEGER